MKRKVKLGFLIVILIGGLYFGLRFMFGIFTPFNFWTAQKDIENHNIQIIAIGELPLNFDQKQKLAKSYGFSFHLYGCESSSDIINGTNYYNAVMIDFLEKKHGKGWWKKFQSERDSIDNAK